MVGIAEYYKRIVVLQPCLELVKQNHSKLDGAGMNTAMIDSVHGKKNWDAEFIYTTPQTLSKNLDKCPEPDLLIIDECNVAYSGNMMDKIFAHWTHCKVAGFTATPYYYKRKTVYKNGWMCSQTTIVSIEEQYGPAVINIDRIEGNRLGYSPDIQLKKVPIAPLTTDHINNPVVYGKIINEHLHGVSDLCKTLKNGIIYCDSIAHAELLSRTFNIPCVFGNTPKKQRVDLIERFNAGRIPFLLTVGCLTRGYDRQDLENIIILTNVNNSCEAEQIIGRLARGNCKKVCYYNRRINTKPPRVGDTEIVKIKKL